MLFLLAAAVVGLLAAQPATAIAPQPNNVLEDPNLLTRHEPAPIPPTKRPVGNRSAQPSGRDYSGRTYTKEEVILLIKDYSARYGISADLPLRIAQCESGYNQFSKNARSTASGVFQYLASTWVGTDEGKAGLNVFDADANIRAAIKYIASRGQATPWNASKGCWDT